MLTIFEYLKEFWFFWFPDTFANGSIIDLLALVSTIGFIYFCLLLPLFRLANRLGGK